MRLLYILLAHTVPVCPIRLQPQIIACIPVRLHRNHDLQAVALREILVDSPDGDTVFIAWPQPDWPVDYERLVIGLNKLSVAELEKNSCITRTYFSESYFKFILLCIPTTSSLSERVFSTALSDMIRVTSGTTVQHQRLPSFLLSWCFVLFGLVLCVPSVLWHCWLGHLTRN